MLKIDQFYYWIEKFKEVSIPSNSFEHLSTSQSIQLLYFFWVGNDTKRLLTWFFLIYTILLFLSLIWFFRPVLESIYSTTSYTKKKNTILIDSMVERFLGIFLPYYQISSNIADSNLLISVKKRNWNPFFFPFFFSIIDIDKELRNQVSFKLIILANRFYIDNK